MEICDTTVPKTRYTTVAREKAAGATYTPKDLADFVAERMVEAFEAYPVAEPLRILDPAIGDGELLVSLLEHLREHRHMDIEVHGYEVCQEALSISTTRIKRLFPEVRLHFNCGSFLEYVETEFGIEQANSLFRPTNHKSFDLIIANPPYVRTQIMGASRARTLAKQFGLSGRVDLYYAFIVGMAQMLKPGGIAGIIVSNRFMTTRSGASVRQALRERLALLHIWDLGDTRLFNAAVLPAVLLAQGKNGVSHAPPVFTSIYETGGEPSATAASPIQALYCNDVVQLRDGRRFFVRHGKLGTSGTPDGVWRVVTATAEAWLKTVEMHTWGTFRTIGKIRVGVKTCADKVFIRSDWAELPNQEQPELLKPLLTHHVARRFKAGTPVQPKQILYPHQVEGDRCRAVNLSCYPRSRAYLERHRATLESRQYVIEGGRKWYEIWVPQDPSAWDQPKLVFRDIAEEPVFWIDLGGAVVNGDCYWVTCEDPRQTDLLWLAAAVGNSTFIERFYDTRFQNKLYAGRRRFITQYVEKFPLPDPLSSMGKRIICIAKELYSSVPSPEGEALQADLNRMVWDAFGLDIEETSW